MVNKSSYVGNEGKYVPNKDLKVKKFGNSTHIVTPLCFMGRRVKYIEFEDE